MRAAWGIYRTMQTFIEDMDSHARNGYDDDIDMDFRSVRLTFVCGRRIADEYRV